MDVLPSRSPSTRPPAADLAIQVLTVNVHKGFSLFNRRFVLPELRDALRAAGADLVFLQEVLGAHQAHQARQPRWPTQPQWEFLGDTVWGYSAYGRNAVYTQGHHGNAMLSKYPILRHQNHDVSVGDVERRGLLHCVIQPPETAELHTICVHLGLTEQQRHSQLCALRRLVDEELPPAAPLIVAGDFNDWRGHAHAALSASGLHEVFVRARGRAARSFPVWWPLLRLDRIYFRNLRVAACKVLSRRPWSRLSDHAALRAELTR